MIEKIKCTMCQHYLGKLQCKAFPDGILEEIASNKKEHNQIIVGQKGNYVFKEKERKTKVM